MNILYTYSNCSPHKYKSLVESSGIMILQQAQKYHQLLLEGISEIGLNIVAFSCLPVNRQLTKKLFFKSEKDKYKEINYTYLPFINFPILRNISILLSSFFRTIGFFVKNRDTVVICDILNISVTSGALLATKLLRKKAIGIVTDVPGILADGNNVKVPITQKINRWILSKFDAYLFLTEQMNTLINKENRPFVVIEGQVDIGMSSNENILDNKYDKKVCIYSGSLKSIYGIKMLTQAFIDANVENSELHVYGDGDFTNELREISRCNEKIRYFGVKPNSYVVDEQLKALLLINPRPTNEEYTKYSYPSKNMEYMVSGTPTLTTKLPGMPKEYNEFVYLIENETVEGLSQILRDVLSKPREELHKKGLKAKEFVLREKNNVIQAKKILGMIQKFQGEN